ncbi:glycerophosphodiester phosphodiesterase domain-containing protein 5-like isoform X2 [Synchiropus splendidus]|uniref:glycerophosphodiester phosphodiesterase domain-containing protein 5-like isoform X2 n=1 Tax=Synchiropus splendidus TaxID=270530 RepID=UPI00237ECCAD|nr:glycerophosphodiester phosphodiesterase domain-containing protein 5-like isoform X2 [Synchiropus splendidus]
MDTRRLRPEVEKGRSAELLRRLRGLSLVFCLSALYSCRRRGETSFSQDRSVHCCSQVEAVSFILLLITFFFSLVFVFFWGQAKNDYNDFDWFNFGHMGFWFSWSLLLLAIAVGLFIYMSMLVLLAVCLLVERQKLFLHWSHKVGLLVTLLFSVVATAVLSALWSQEWTTLLLSFQITAPFLHVSGVLLMTSLAWPVALYFFCLRTPARRAAILSVYLTLLSALYLLPLAFHSPCLRDRATLPPPPALFGHRGAPMLAPENTMMSFQKAVETGSDGLETDVTISWDGVPFLMHDQTLRRTTNVQQVFPDRTNSEAADFTWEELQNLDAGSWFLNDDPFGSVGSLGSSERVEVANQSVCSLLDFLQLAARTGQLVIFDLYRPPKGHPYRDSWIHQILEVIQIQSSIPSAQVLWLPSHLRPLVQQMDPDLQQTTGSLLSPEQIQENNIVRLNLHYRHMSASLVSNYSALNVSTNLYVVSEPWIYSLAWCSGVHSVTTNAPHLLHTLKRPLFLMTGHADIQRSYSDVLESSSAPFGMDAVSMATETNQIKNQDGVLRF